MKLKLTEDIIELITHGKFLREESKFSNKDALLIFSCLDYKNRIFKGRKYFFKYYSYPLLEIKIELSFVELKESTEDKEHLPIYSVHSLKNHDGVFKLEGSEAAYHLNLNGVEINKVTKFNSGKSKDFIGVFEGISF